MFYLIFLPYFNYFKQLRTTSFNINRSVSLLSAGSTINTRCQVDIKIFDSRFQYVKGASHVRCRVKTNETLHVNDSHVRFCSVYSTKRQLGKL